MILITGASDGLGKQIAKLYKEAGKKVINISHDESEYADVNICTSLSEGENIKRATNEILAIGESIEAIINCAGVFSGEKLGEISEAEIKRLMSTNVKSQILLVSNMYERILKDGTDIVNIASSAGMKGTVDQIVYGASKWAVRGFSANLQEEFKGKPNRVISFCPGGIKTKLFEKATGIDRTEDGNSWMRPEDLALLIKQILDLPKNIEVSEIVINRK